MESLVGVVTAVTSAITGAVVSYELVLLEYSSLSSLQEMMVKPKNKIRKTNKTFFIFSSIPIIKYY